MTDSKLVRFPCERLPEDPSQARLLGDYPQRPTGSHMQRVKVFEGRMTLEQWEGLAQLAAAYTPEYPLHMTTRQNLELHGIRLEDVPSVQQRMDRLGLTGAAACGDSVRNITVCPGHGCCADTWDVGQLVHAIRVAVESLPWRQNLPRKFKISVSGCPRACGRPWINDVGLVANPNGTFRAILAGSLGAKPNLGLLAYDSLPVDDVVPLVVAVLRWFHAEGDRTSRSRARLRHLRERLGEDSFRSRMEYLLQEEKREHSWPSATLRLVKTASPPCDRLCLPLGDIAPEALLELVKAVIAVDGEIRLGMCHDLLIFAHAKPTLNPRLAAWRGSGAMVACPGATWCTRGLVDSRAAARRIGQTLPSGCELQIAITGCPNNCSQAATADIGLIGRFIRIGADRVEGFRLCIGGGKGETPVLAEELHPAVPAERVHEAVAWIAQQYECAKDGGTTTFADFVAASGDRLRHEIARQYGMEPLSHVPECFEDAT